MSVAVTKNKQQVSLAIACLSATWRVELVSFVEFAARVARSQGLVPESIESVAVLHWITELNLWLSDSTPRTRNYLELPMILKN